MSEIGAAKAEGVDMRLLVLQTLTKCFKSHTYAHLCEWAAEQLPNASLCI